MVIPVMSGASLTSSVVAKPSADAVSLPEVLLAAVASEVLSLSAVLSETDVLSVWLSETSAADAVDVLLSETAEVPDADDVLLPVDAVLPQAVRRPSVTSLLQEKVRPIFSAFFRFFLSFDIPFLKKKPLPYGSSPFSFFAANYCTYLFSSAFTICWNSSFA